MATCKDCLHYEVCEDARVFDNYEVCDIICDHFKDKTRFIEVPFVAMVNQFIKDGKFDNKRTAHNGKYAVVYIDETKWNCPLIDITEQFYNDEKANERIQALKGSTDNG